MNESRNTFGQAYALTVLTPILEGRETSLAHYLQALLGGSASPLASVPGTHFARWVVIGDVVYEGKGKRDHLQLARLLFTSNFDGSLDAYLESLRIGLAGAVDAIWGHCAGYPGGEDSAAFAAYIRAHQIESSLFFSAYGDRTVEDVKDSLAVRRSIIEFALAAQGMPPDELQAAFEEAFPR
ncbi:MAG: hypothetical protein M3Y17_04630 [Actinomycetota bacterium]|nr:hypothetical protein [Actinomycetota bacterium]